MGFKLPHYLIVGGGLSGLSTAYFLSLAKPIGTCHITVLEASNRWGGWIQSIKSTKTGSTYELGPHSVRFSSNTPNLIVRLAMDIGLQDSILWMTQDRDVGRNIIFANGRLVPLSTTSPRVAQPFIHLPLLLTLKRMISPRPPRKEDWTVDEFLRTRLNDEFADYLGSAFVRGVFGGDSRQLSARACLSTLVEAEDLGPNLILGLLRSGLKPKNNINWIPSLIDSRLPQLKNLPPHTFAWSISTGMQTLTDTLAEKLSKMAPHVNLHLNSPVTSIKPSSNHIEVGWQGNSHSKTDKADAVFMCCPSFKAAELLNNSIPPDLLDILGKQSTPWTDIVVVALEVAAPADPPIRGFGHLVPLKEDAHIMGIVYDSVALPSLSGSSDTFRYTVMMKPYTEWLESTTNPSDEVLNAIRNAACAALKQQLGIVDPVVVDQHIEISRSCIPQYALSHKKRLSKLRDGIDKLMNSSNSNLYFVGYSYDGVGQTDVVRSALKAVTQELKLV